MTFGQGVRATRGTGVFGRRMGARLVVVLGLAGAGFATVGASAADPTIQRIAPQNRTQVEMSYAPVVAEVEPAVVNIYTRRVIRTPGVSSLFDDPFFRRFFGGFGPGVPRERIQNSLGSGVVVTPNGVIVTNNHVIRKADQITVVLSDRREFAAKVILADEQTDLAVLRIDTGKTPLPFLRYRPTDEVEIGDLVLAIGNPFGVGKTVTSGIVSALSRTGVGISDYQFFIQTDAAINPGNSGGALVGLDGRLIGINTAIYSRSGGSHGIGFAIPADMVRKVVESALSDGKLVRPWLGANSQAVTAEISESLGLDRPVGVLVNETFSGGPADRAGLKVGDLILAIDGHEIFDPQALQFRLALGRIGGTAKLKVRRGGREFTLDVPLEPPPERPPRDTTVLSTRSPFQGATIVNLSPAVAAELRLDTFQRGVIVTAVEPGSPANRIGLLPGDIFVSIDGGQIHTVKQLVKIVDDHVGDWMIRIRRNGRILSLTLRS